VTVRLIGGPTAVIESGGLAAANRPDVPRAGPIASGTRTQTKTQPPAVPADDIGPTDAVLLSRDQHGDSLDHSGRDLLTRVPLLLTTAAAGQAAQLLGARTVISAHV
jgi:hypothetical protein